MRLFVDLDGVLADFDLGYAEMVGDKLRRPTGEVDWDRVKAVPHFFYRLNHMPDMWRLWGYVKHFNPTIITGTPPEIATAEDDKKGWVSDYFGPSVPVICCLSKDKSKYCNPGDILVDDWEKYKHLWERAGGTWITHVDANTTIEQLKRCGF
jgi:5'(3')-deoxyribonucleotidase